MSGAETIRMIYQEFGMIDAAKVQELAKARGVEVSTSLVYTTRSRLKLTQSREYELDTRVALKTGEDTQIMSFRELLKLAGLTADYLLVFENPH